MSRFLRRRGKTKGLPPGSLVYLGKKDPGPLEITFVSFNKEQFIEKRNASLEECIEGSENRALTTWIDITGLADKEVMRSVGEKFGIHSLWLEDVLNTDHRPKIEELDDLMFIIMKFPIVGQSAQGKVSFEQINIFLGSNFVISFQEKPSDTFQLIRDRLRKGTGNMRSAKPDYLFYALIDLVVDEYYEVVEELGAQVESMESSMREDFKNFNPDQIILLRNEFLYLRKAAVPIRDSLKSILTTKVDEIDQNNKRFFRDAYDHAIHIVEAIDVYRELLKGQVESYQNWLNIRMNEVMKVLAIFASVFAPLTFIAGIYGMNFRHMPELEWSYGYYICLGLMVVIAGALLYYFKRKDWL